MFLDVFGWVERTPLSVFVRESLWAFPLMLILHAIGMGFLAGGAGLLAIRHLGFEKFSLPGAEKLVSVLWGAFWLSLFSGLMLLAAYPAKALTNPVFGLKFVLLGGALYLTWRSVRDATQSRWTAASTLALLVGAIFAGRFLAYTHTILMAY